MPPLQETRSGLTQKEAMDRLHKDGPNRIQQEAARSPVFLFFSQFKSPLVLILIFASIVALSLGEIKEAFAIGTILFLNALVGFFQEYRAETSIAALKNLTAPRATVLRDGKKMVVPADELVCGDLLILEAGDIVGADARILTFSRLQVNEAVLTGESVPVFKTAMNDKTGKVFMGTSVTNGTAEALVTETGMQTELGKIAHLISTAQNDLTPLQQQLEHLGKTLLYICIAIVVLVAGIGWLRGFSGVELLIFSISLAVAAVPEGLPAIVTVALALGIERLAKKKALVRKLPSVETLGSVSIICTDKTGTLTTGHMRVRELWASAGDVQNMLYAAAACCDAELKDQSDFGTGDPTEIAILLAAREKGIQKKLIETENPRVSTEPFDSERKRMSIYRSDKRNYVKGAVESLITLCHCTPEEKKEILRQTEKMSDIGLRVLGVAVGNSAAESDLQFAGLLGIADPPRPEAIQAIREARGAGIIPIMITGDHPHTAAAIARELGLLLDGEPAAERVHSRATPEDKLKLVRYWKEKGHVVAMTGDGVNDAPALREAHIGIAMGQAGTEVTKQAADLILTDDNFSTIVHAVHEGRGIYQNIRKAIVYLLTGNFAEILVVLGAVVVGLPLPLLASHLLWINLVTDAFPALTLIADPLTPQLMKEKPRALKERIIGKREWRVILLTGLLEAVVVLSVFEYVLLTKSEIHARSIAFTTIVFSQVFRILGARSFTQIFWRVGAFSNWWLLAVMAFTLSLQVSLHYIPITQKIFEVSALHLEDFGVIIPAAFVSISVIEIVKLIRATYNNSK